MTYLIDKFKLVKYKDKSQIKIVEIYRQIIVFELLLQEQNCQKEMIVSEHKRTSYDFDGSIAK